MNKGELVDAIAKESKLSKADAEKALSAFVVVTTSITFLPRFCQTSLCH